jgi:hypothetical protein
MEKSFFRRCRPEHGLGAEDRRWVHGTHLVPEQLDDVQVDLTDDEAGESGYVSRQKDCDL